jgi:hypothetical protein
MDWLPEVAALTAIASFVLAVVSKAYKYMQKRKALGNSDQAGANNGGLRAGRNVSARFQQSEAGIAFIAGGNVNIQRARNDVTPRSRRPADESRTIAKGFEPPRAI